MSAHCSVGRPAALSLHEFPLTIFLLGLVSFAKVVTGVGEVTIREALGSFWTKDMHGRCVERGETLEVMTNAHLASLACEADATAARLGRVTLKELASAFELPVEVTSRVGLVSMFSPLRIGLFRHTVSASTPCEWEMFSLPLIQKFSGGTATSAYEGPIPFCLDLVTYGSRRGTHPIMGVNKLTTLTRKKS